MRRVIRITRSQYQRYVLNLQRTKKENSKVVMNIKPNTNHAALATQVERQVEKKSYTHDTTHRNRQTDKRNVREGDQGYYW